MNRGRLAHSLIRFGVMLACAYFIIGCATPRKPVSTLADLGPERVLTVGGRPYRTYYSERVIRILSPVFRRAYRFRYKIDAASAASASLIRRQATPHSIRRC